MCIEDGAAAVRGVTVGSKVVSLNGQNMLGKPYIEVRVKSDLTRVSSGPRALWRSLLCGVLGVIGAAA